MIKIAANSVLDYSATVLGNGSIQKNTHTVTLSSTANSDKAYISRFVAARGGSRVLVRATARCLTTPESGKEMKLGIDNYKQGLVNQIVVNSMDWKTYEIATVIPYDKTDIVNFKAVIGAWSNQIAQIEVAELDIFVENAGFASARVHAMGAVDLSTATVKLNEQNIAVGIKDVMYQDNTLIIQTDDFSKASQLGIYPVQTVQLSGSLKCMAQAYISEFNRSTGVMKIKFASLQTGENVDIRAAPYTDGGNVLKLNMTSLF